MGGGEADQVPSVETVVRTTSSFARRTSTWLPGRPMPQTSMSLQLQHHPVAERQGPAKDGTP